jgi:LmbE family N-acetylglucosaminyl deacetylase
LSRGYESEIERKHHALRQQAGEYEKIGFRVVIELVSGPFRRFDDRPVSCLCGIELIWKGGQVGHDPHYPCILDRPRLSKLATKLLRGCPVLTPCTTEQTWIASLSLLPDWPAEDKPTVIVAPHPDDETLATGGLIAMQRVRQIPVTLLAVTDGEAAYPDVPDLGAHRQVEQTRAAEALGVSRDAIIRLGLPDSAVSGHEPDLVDQIAASINSDTLLVAPWPRDPHPDHEACGRAAQAAAHRTGAALVFYFFWTWHHFGPDCLSGLPLRRVALSADALSRRAGALACHRSQLHRDEGDPILPEVLLAPARRPFETFAVYGHQYSF